MYKLLLTIKLYDYKSTRNGHARKICTIIIIIITESFNGKTRYKQHSRGNNQ